MDILPLLVTIWSVAFTSFIALNFGYLLFAFILAKIKGKVVQKSHTFAPLISILVPCYNVESKIERKIRDTLEIDYPRNNFEIIVVESGSTDDTWTVLLKHFSHGEVELLRQPKRLGKPSAINLGLKECKGEIIVLTDADARLERRAIRELVKNFADQSVGAVVGNLTITQGKSVASKMNHLFYQIFRQKLRAWESMFDSASFWSGELCAFRKSILEKIDEDIINDDRYILLKVRSAGYRSICEVSSRAYEPDAESISSQISHKRRTTAGTIQGTLRFKHMLFNPKYGLFGMLILPFHFLRVILLPILLLIVEALSPFAIATFVMWSPVGVFFLVAVIVALLLPFLFKSGQKLLYSFFYGFIVQIAILVGMADYVLKRQSVLWPQITKP